MFTYSAEVEYTSGKTETVSLQMDGCVAAGYTGRNRDAVNQHIEELQKLGVATPYDVPALYWISPQRLTRHPAVWVVGPETSPEAEFFMAADASGNLFMTVASDHTDRELETVSVGKSKQICDKVLGDRFWAVAEISDHWDEIQIASRVFLNGEWISYQSGGLGNIMACPDLMDLIRKDDPVGSHPSFLSGTVPIIGGEFIFPSACEIRLSDPVLKRDLIKYYEIIVLPDRS